MDIDIQDGEWHSEVNGGYSIFSGSMLDSVRLAYPNLTRAWIPLQVAIDPAETGTMTNFAGTVVWDGYLIGDAMPTEDGTATVRGIGAKALAEDSHQNLLYSVYTNPEDWQPEDGDPFNFDDNDPDYSVELKNSVKFIRSPGSYGNGEHVGVCLWMSGFWLRKLAFHIHKPSAWTTPNTVVRVSRFTGPTGSTSAVHDVDFTTSWSDQDVSTGSMPTATDALRLQMLCINDATATAPARAATLTKVKIYGIADDDSWVAGGITRSITNDVAGTRLLYATPGALNPSTTQPVLPVVWDKENPLSDLLDQMAEFEGRWWGVWERDANGRFQFAFSPWNAAPSTAWTATLSMISGRADPSDDVYNQVRVFYKDVTGRSQIVEVSADGLNGRPSDPFVGTRRALGLQPRTLTYGLDNDQVDGGLAQSVASALLGDYATPQYSGQISLLSAFASGIEKPACVIRAGDTITISDYTAVGPKTFRVYGTTNTSVLTTLDVGRKATTEERILARAEKLASRHQRWKG